MECHSCYLPAAPFPESYFSEKVSSMDAVTWWKAVGKSSALPSSFIGLVNQLLTSPASSASVERIFSNFSYVHSKLKNRLGVERAAKLVFCYRTLRGPKEPDY